MLGLRDKAPKPALTLGWLFRVLKGLHHLDLHKGWHLLVTGVEKGKLLLLGDPSPGIALPVGSGLEVLEWDGGC